MDGLGLIIFFNERDSIYIGDFQNNHKHGFGKEYIKGKIVF